MSVSPSTLHVISGDILDQKVDVIVHPWQRHWIPGTSFSSSRVSDSIKKWAGQEPFQELSRHHKIKPGGAVMTRAGHLPHRAIIHCAGDGPLKRASEHSIRSCLVDALNLARGKGYRSIAFPLMRCRQWNDDETVSAMSDICRQQGFDGDIFLVKEKG
ncbi:Macro domain-containing protein [Sulfidibacter corallicola]|uniref:Macro domain-containing protein n=1 Tax=Sulfidibacter corallicola TaxID=2818388 RepID=A0A8A4TNR3_SULCO|nr:macro domain-containing protein [Sulfidibacter corallicola]QTD51193.1 macro domain-containing protein [Sulfidibacter corallicola]